MGGAERTAVIRVAIVDDDPWAMSKLAEFLDGLDDMVVLDKCISVDALLAGPGSSADVVVLDAQLRFDPVVVENVRRAGQHGARVLLVSAYFDEQDLRGALGAGAAGFSPKVGSFAFSADAIRAVVAGQAVLSREAMLAALNNPNPSAPRLAPREIDVLALSSTGLTARAVARRLGIAEHTVKENLKKIRAKYRAAGRKVDSMIELRTEALQDGILTDGRTVLGPTGPGDAGGIDPSESAC